MAYDPYNDPDCTARDDDRRRARQYEKYTSPFQRDAPTQPPKRRKLSNDDESPNDESSDKASLAIEPAAPVSEMSWLALEFFLLVHRNTDQAKDVVMAALLRLMHRY